MSVYRQQRQREQEQREAVARKQLEDIVQCAEFFTGQLEQHFAGKIVDPSTLSNAEAFLRSHIPQLPERLRQRVQYSLQRFSG